jgi:hypothetical protein
MVMVVVEESRKEALEVALARAGAEGYTEIAPAAGLGTTGPRLGSGAFPRTSAVVFSIVAAEGLARLRTALAGFCQDCDPRPRVIAWDVEEIGETE